MLHQRLLWKLKAPGRSSGMRGQSTRKGATSLKVKYKLSLLQSGKSLEFLAPDESEDVSLPNSGVIYPQWDS